MDYCLVELPAPFLSDLQARFGMFRALLLNRFAGTWTLANFVQASKKLAFQEQLWPNKQATQTGAAGVPAVSFDDSTVDNKSRLADAWCQCMQKGLLFKLHCRQPVKELQTWISHEWIVYSHTP